MTTIPIERLAPDTVIHHTGLDFGPFGSFAVVETVEFNGESYAISGRFLDEHGNVSRHTVEFIADAGDAITYGGRGEPKLRPEADVSVDEWQAKIEANSAAITELIAEQNRRAVFFGAVARALGVPVLEAAE